MQIDQLQQLMLNVYLRQTEQTINNYFVSSLVSPPEGELGKAFNAINKLTEAKNVFLANLQPKTEEQLQEEK